MKHMSRPAKQGSQFAAMIRGAIWEVQFSELPSWKQWLIRVVRIAHLVIRDLMGEGLTLRSMSLVYTTLLSMVPLLAVSFSVLKGFGVHNQIEPILLNLLLPLGEKSSVITAQIITFVENTKVGALGTVGLALLIFTAVTLVQKIERAFNHTWRVTHHRSLGNRFSNYLSIILIGPVLIFTAIGITATITSHSLVQQLMAYPILGGLIHAGGRMIPYLLVIIAFTLVYAFVPNTKVKLKSAFIGALVAGLLWESVGWGFATFVASSGQYTAIYSALASLIVFMIWMQLSWLILLIGASISFYHQHPEHHTLQSHDRLSSRLKEKLTLTIMALITKNYYEKQLPWTARALAQHLQMPLDAITPLLKSLVANELLVHTDEPIPGLLPAQAPENLKLKDIISVVRCIDENSHFNLDRLPENERVDNVFNNLEQSMQESLHEETIKQLLPVEMQKK